MAASIRAKLGIDDPLVVGHDVPSSLDTGGPHWPPAIHRFAVITTIDMRQV
jgi:hypothetical protein